MKAKKINDGLSIEERHKIILEAIGKQTVVFHKKSELLKPFISDIKLMNEKKITVNSQLRILESAGLKISYRTYKSFLDGLDKEIPAGISAPKKAVPDADNNPVTVILNDKGAVKTYAVKEEIKKLGFTWDKDRKGWKKDVNSSELEKVKELKVGYDIIK